MENENLAIRYVEGVKKANPEKTNPTWGLVETAFLAGMEEQSRTQDLKNHIRHCGTIKPEEILELAKKMGFQVDINYHLTSNI
jgi:uncharacterized protein YmfQ (DUF2313 family)